MKKKQKRKQIVNYLVKKYKGIMFGWLIVGRNHPLFGKNLPIPILYSLPLGVYKSEPFGGNRKIWYNTVKKKFRNLNFYIFCFHAHSMDKKEFTKALLEIRSDFIMEYIKSKREENKND